MPAFLWALTRLAIAPVVNEWPSLATPFQKAYFRPRLTLLYFWLLSPKRPL